jgi:hypothetical protein
MPAQDGCSAHGLLYLAAVRDDWCHQEHCQPCLDVGLSAWELACHALLSTVFAGQGLFALPVDDRPRPSQTVASGTQRARCTTRPVGTSQERRCHWVSPGWNKARHTLPSGGPSATFLTCVFSSHHFSSYPASSRSDVPSLCPARASSSRSQRAMWPTITFTLSDLPRTVRGHPLASAGVCGGCYSLSYSRVKGLRWLLGAARYRTRIARRITSLAWREAVTPT